MPIILWFEFGFVLQQASHIQVGDLWSQYIDKRECAIKPREVQYPTTGN
jgi:hypothetical protein